MRHFLVFSMVSLVLAASDSLAESFQVEFDGEDPALEIVSGAWGLDKTGSFNGNYRFSAPGPADGSSHAVWTLDGLPPAEYDVEFYVDNGNYAANAEYIVESAAGVETVTVSQNFVGEGWHALGTFTFRHAGRITQTDYWVGAGTKVIADALRVTTSVAPQTSTYRSQPPFVTITIDDLGGYDPNNSSSPTGQLFAAAPNASYAVFPFSSYTQQVLAAGTSQSIEILLHQPMQYVGQPDYNASDPQRLYINMTDNEIRNTLNTNLDAVDHGVSGINNHQGSRFSQYRHGLDIVMEELKARGLYFFDSRTITDAVGFDAARDAGLLTVERDLFIDGETTQETIDKILSLAHRALAAPNNVYTGIGHQRTHTTPGVIAAVAELESLGVELAPVSRALSLIVETHSQPAGSSFSTAGEWTESDNDMMSQSLRDGTALHAEGGTEALAQFIASVTRPGRYRVFMGFPYDPSNAENVQIVISTGAVVYTLSLDQSRDPGRWHYLGSMNFDEGDAIIAIDAAHAEAGTRVWADAIRLQYAGEAVESGGTTWLLY